eukprot:1157302-Pelagomonas_calceolata.AAC.21
MNRMFAMCTHPPLVKDRLSWDVLEAAKGEAREPDKRVLILGLYGSKGVPTSAPPSAHLCFRFAREGVDALITRPALLAEGGLRESDLDKPRLAERVAKGVAPAEGENGAAGSGVAGECEGPGDARELSPRSWLAEGVVQEKEGGPLVFQECVFVDGGSREDESHVWEAEKAFIAFQSARPSWPCQPVQEKVHTHSNRGGSR